MSTRTAQITDEYGRPVPGATIYVYNSDGTAATVTSDGVTPLAQPISVDEFGTYTYQGAGNVYREDVYYAGKLRYRVVVQDSPLDATLRADAAASTGAGLVGFIDNGVGAVATTVRDFLRQITHKASGQFFANVGAKVQRFRDRVLIADAADALATNVSAQGDWLTTYELAYGRATGLLEFSQAAVLTSNGPNAGNAFLAGARTSSRGGLTGNSIGLLGVGVNDNTSASTQAYGGYFEGYRKLSAVGGAYGIEIDVINKASTAASDPFNQATSQTVGLQLASGGAYGAGLFSSSVAINIRSNASDFLSGIQFGSDSLKITSGRAEALALTGASAGHGLQWYGAAGVKTSSIYSDGTTAVNGVTQRFGEGFVSFLNGAGTPKVIARIASTASGVNYLAIINSVAASPAQIAAEGDDTAIGIKIVPKGTGGAATVQIPIANVPSYANDAAAAAGSVPVGGIYRNGSVLMIRAA